MATVVALYNDLPLVEDADRKFVDRPQIFSKLAPLFAAYDNQFGACLVHAHCKLEDGEMMVASGNVSQPKRNTQCYPERWLGSGEPYEFNSRPTISPPPDLLCKFKSIVDGIDVLGIYFAGDIQSSGILLEWTEGRTNLTKIVTETIDLPFIETAWIPGKGPSPVTMMCIIGCVAAVNGTHTAGHWKY
jgi:hypothetical protein